MHELDRILAALDFSSGSTPREAVPDGVLTTVVHVQGPAIGISGGCLEGDVSKKAWWFTEGGRPSVRVYDTSAEDDAVWEFGLGCNGVVHALFERIQDASTQELLQFLAQRRRERKPAAVATVIAAASELTCSPACAIVSSTARRILRIYPPATSWSNGCRLRYPSSCLEQATMPCLW